MPLEKTLRVLNDLVREGLVINYAIGGAIAATFYMEPVATYDLDVFVSLTEGQTDLLLLSPIYEALKSRGFQAEAEYVNVAGVPVQFLPAHNDLLKEALAEARRVGVGNVVANVMPAEYLMAIMLETGRPKDSARLAQMLEQANFNMALFESVIDRHGLRSRWDAFRQ